MKTILTQDFYDERQLKDTTSNELSYKNSRTLESKDDATFKWIKV